MKRLKRAKRLFWLLFLIALALTGIGGYSIFYTREKYQGKEIRIELVDKKKDEHDGEVKDVQ